MGAEDRGDGPRGLRVKIGRIEASFDEAAHPVADERRSTTETTLGREFLLWLWYRFETAGGVHEIEGFGKVSVALDSILELSSDAEPGRILLRGDAPTRRPEAAASLRSGRLPRCARLLVAHGPDTLEVTLDADRFDLCSVRVVADAAEPEGGERNFSLEERCGRLFDLSAIIDRLFERFLGERLGKSFDEKLLPEIRSWIFSREAPARRRAAGAS